MQHPPPKNTHTHAHNTTQINTFHGKFQYLFIESICNDEAVLEANYRAKMRYSPDYKGMDPEQALRDFKQRIQKYLDVYEPLFDRRSHYIKMIDMVTGRGHMDVNRLSGACVRAAAIARTRPALRDGAVRGRARSADAGALAIARARARARLKEQPPPLPPPPKKTRLK